MLFIMMSSMWLAIPSSATRSQSPTSVVMSVNITSTLSSCTMCAPYSVPPTAMTPQRSRRPSWLSAISFMPAGVYASSHTVPTAYTRHLIAASNLNCGRACCVSQSQE